MPRPRNAQRLHISFALITWPALWLCRMKQAIPCGDIAEQGRRRSRRRRRRWRGRGRGKRGRGRRGNCFNKQNHWHLRNKQSTSNDVGNQRPAGIMADRSKQEGREGERKRGRGAGKWRVETAAWPRQRQKQSDIHLLFKTANAIRAFTWKPSTNVTSGNTSGTSRGRGGRGGRVWWTDSRVPVRIA